MKLLSLFVLFISTVYVDAQVTTLTESVHIGGIYENRRAEVLEVKDERAEVLRELEKILIINRRELRELRNDVSLPELDRRVSQTSKTLTIKYLEQEITNIRKRTKNTTEPIVTRFIQFERDKRNVSLEEVQKRAVQEREVVLKKAREELKEARRDAKSETNIDVRRAKVALREQEAMWALTIAELALVEALNKNKPEEELEPLREAVVRGHKRLINIQTLIEEENLEAKGVNICATCGGIAPLHNVQIDDRNVNTNPQIAAEIGTPSSHDGKSGSRY